jgi:hypothetical protein
MSLDLRIESVDMGNGTRGESREALSKPPISQRMTARPGTLCRAGAPVTPSQRMPASPGSLCQAGAPLTAMDTSGELCDQGAA